MYINGSYGTDYSIDITISTRTQERERERDAMKWDLSHHHEWKVDAKLQANAIQRLRAFMSSIKNMYNHS